MNPDCLAEIERIISRTNPPPAHSPLELIAKWVYRDAARMAREGGQPDLAWKIEERTLSPRT